MSDIVLIVKLTAAEGRRDEALAVLGRLADATAEEPGTLQYALCADTTDAVTIWVIERYADEDALNAHAGSSTMAEAMGALGGLLDGMPDMRRVEVVGEKGTAATA